MIWPGCGARPFLLSCGLLALHQYGSVDAQGQRKFVESRRLGYPAPALDLRDRVRCNSCLLGKFGQGHTRANARKLQAMHLSTCFCAYGDGAILLSNCSEM